MVIKHWKLKHWLGRWGKSRGWFIAVCLNAIRLKVELTTDIATHSFWCFQVACLTTISVTDFTSIWLTEHEASKLSSKSKLMFVILQHILNVLKTYLRPPFLRNPMNFTPKTLWEFSTYRYIQKVISLPVITKWLSLNGWMRHGGADPKHTETIVIKSSPRLADFTISVFVYYTCVTIFLPPASLLAVKANRYVDV